ncbi:G-protein coupled receptor family C group 5 member C isoform X2 [Vanacampus margaritifer]
MASNASQPAGCGPEVWPLYFALCDLDAAWGVAVEAFASAGVAVSLVLFIALLANVPFTRERHRRNAVALHAGFLACTAGLFGLTFAFIVGKNFSTCASRRFLFGVLFAGCFSCLLVQGVRLNALARTERAPRAWTSCLAALALWSVEVLINAEWLIITVVRRPPGPGGDSIAVPCDVANADFAMALIYVMALLLAALGAGLGVMAGNGKRWRREGALVAACGAVSVGIWAAWIAMYVHGNRGPRWDDPTLAVALALNAWVFLALISVPQVCCSANGDADGESECGESAYPRGGVCYENILKERNARNVFADNIDNKAFSMDENAQGANMVSPYSGYTGQLRSCVYQPTELALITKARLAANPAADSAIPRASAAGGGDVRVANVTGVTDAVNVAYANGSGRRVAQDA